jgi:hypothetical protein
MSFEAFQPMLDWIERKNGEIGARREAARSRVGNPASTATKYGGDSRHFCLEIYGSGH